MLPHRQDRCASPLPRPQLHSDCATCWLQQQAVCFYWLLIIIGVPLRPYCCPGLHSVQCRRLKDLLTAASQAAVQQLLQIVCNAARDSTLQIADDYAVSLWAWDPSAWSVAGLPLGCLHVPTPTRNPPPR